MEKNNKAAKKSTTTEKTIKKTTALAIAKAKADTKSIIKLTPINDKTKKVISDPLKQKNMNSIVSVKKKVAPVKAAIAKAKTNKSIILSSSGNASGDEKSIFDFNFSSFYNNINWGYLIYFLI